MRQMLASNVGIKCWRQMLAANVCGFPKYMRQMLASNLCGFVKLLRHIIYDRNKADVEISASIKIYAPNVFVHQKIGAQTLTIWARQNLQLLTSSKSGWRALVQVMLPLLHVVLKWLEHSGRPAYMGGVSPVLYRLLFRHDLPIYLRPVQISVGAYIFTISWGKIKNLSRLISVLSLHFKFVHDHKSCPSSAATQHNACIYFYITSLFLISPFAEIFANECFQRCQRHRKKEKNFDIEFFNILLRA